MKPTNLFHILIVDDEKFNIELAAVYLKEEGYRLSYATNGMSAIEGAGKKKIDLILLDVNMPEVDGFQVCKALKRDPQTKDIPVIFLTAQTDIQYISKAFEAGGVDYITKPFNGVELKARVRTHLQNVTYLEEIKHKQEKFAQLSIVDPLTKVHNMLYFDSLLKMAQKKGEPYWFVYLKINRFDTINTLFGFSRANKILRLFAKTLQENIPNTAVVARLHGVGFGMLLKDYEPSYMQKLYKNLNDVIIQKQEVLGIKDYAVVFCHVEKSSVSIESLYKKIQNSLSEIDEEAKRYLFTSV